MEYNPSWSFLEKVLDTRIRTMYGNMIVSIKSTNITNISASTRDYLDEKIVGLVEKIFKKEDQLIKLDLEVGRVTRHHKHGKVFRAEANLSVGSTVLYADAVGDNLNEAIDLLEEELKRGIKKFREKRTALERKGARVFKNKR